MELALTRAALDVVRANSLASLARVACEVLAGTDAALARLWLVDDRGDLRLEASAGFPVGGGTYHRVDGTFGRIPSGTGKIGRIAASGEALIVRTVRGDEEWLDNPGWIARQGVRAFVGLPLVADGSSVGVIAVFARAPLSDGTLTDWQFFADLVAVRVTALTAVDAEKRNRPIYTRGELRTLEKTSIALALRHTRGKVFGADGAAQLLQMKPTTLLSRMKALGIVPRE